MDLPAGDVPPLHLHRDEDEGFYVLGGSVTIYLPDRSVTLDAGDFLLAPRGVPHAYEVGADGARVLVASAPSGFERFVVAVDALEQLSPETSDGPPPSTASTSSVLPARALNALPPP